MVEYHLNKSYKHYSEYNQSFQGLSEVVVLDLIKNIQICIFCFCIRNLIKQPQAGFVIDEMQSVKKDSWVAVKYENNWYPGIVIQVNI